MPTTQLLGLIVGLAFTYLLLSLMVTSLNELLAWFFELRSKTLQKGLANLLGEPGPRKFWSRVWASITMRKPTGEMVNWLYDHALVRVLAQGQVLPSYIPSRTFATAMIDLLKDKAGAYAANAAAGNVPQGPVAEAHVVQQIKAAITLLPNEELKTSLRAILDETVADVDGARARLATWYDDAMDRISGWYKRRAQVQTIICASLLTIALNADSIVIGTALWKDPVLRDAIKSAATEIVKNPPPGVTPKAAAPAAPDSTAAPATAAPAPPGAAAPATTDQATPPPFPKDAYATIVNNYAQLKSENLPIGWHYEVTSIRELCNWGWRAWTYKLLGLLLTILALLQGAPFWFDMLSRFVRSSGPKPEKQKEAAPSEG